MYCHQRRKNPHMKKSKAAGVAKRVPIAEVPEVQILEQTMRRIESLKAAHPEIFDELAELVDKYNTHLDEANKAIESKQVSCGPFENISSSTRYDAEKMYDMVGEQDFLKWGGIMRKTTVYELDKTQVERHISCGDIPDECIEEFRTVQRSWRRPKKIVLP